MEPKLFEVTEVNDLIPRLNSAFSRISLIKREVVELIGELRGLGYEPPSAAPPKKLPEEPETRARAERLYKLLDALRAEIEGIEQTGGVLKDLDMGLVDFYGLREGKVVCLCWQHGEPEIMYWHEVETGFKDRQPLSEESIANRRRLN
jgi:hypothetical protein